MLCVLSLCIGTEFVALGTVWRALTDYSDTGNEWIVVDLRIPRTVLGIVVGVALGVSGALIQSVFRNPLGDSQILGINSGAGLAVVCAFGGAGRPGAAVPSVVGPTVLLVVGPTVLSARRSAYRR